MNNYLIQSNLTYIRVRDELNIIKRGAPFTQGIGVHRNLVKTIKEVVLERKDYFFEQMSERGLDPEDGSKCLQWQLRSMLSLHACPCVFTHMYGCK